MEQEYDLEDLKGLYEDNMKTFESFKEIHERQEDEIKNLGESTSETQAKLTEISAAIEDNSEKMNKSLRAAKRADDERKAREQALEERLAELEVKSKRPGSDSEDKDNKNVVKLAKQLYHENNDGRLAPNDHEFDLEEAETYKRAFFEYLRKGERMRDDMLRKALSVGVDSDGGYWVVPEIADRVVSRLFDTSPVRQVAGQMTIGSDAVELPKDVDEAATGGWVGETAARTETGTPEVGMQRIPVHEQYANPRATQKILDDASFDVENWLANKIQGILMRTENAAFVNGDGVAKPRGFLDYGTASTTAEDSARAWGIVQHVVSGAAGGFAATDPGDAFITLLHKMKVEFLQGASWAMNRFTMGEVRKFKDGNGNYLWSQGNVIAGQPDTFLGYPIQRFEDMPAHTVGDAFPVAFANWSEAYLIVDRIGIRTLRDPFTAKPNVQFYTTKRVGGDVVNFDAIKLMKIST